MKPIPNAGRGLFILLLSFAILVQSDLASSETSESYALFCLGDGELLDLPNLCNPLMEPRTGPTMICMHFLDNGKICPTSLNTCNGLGLGCFSMNNTPIDIFPPNLTIFSPLQGFVYNFNSILLDLDVNENSYMFMKDNLAEEPEYKNICSRCSDYSRKRTFREGPNNITIKVKDIAGNFILQDLFFFVDSQLPDIINTNPRRDFTNGHFSVEFSEENPVFLYLHYGNEIIGFRNYSVDLESECLKEKNTKCHFDVDLEDYHNRFIKYWAEIIDIANGTDTSKEITLMIDTNEPIVNEFSYTIIGGNINFHLSIVEENLDSVEYIDYLLPNPKWKRLCSKLKNGVCDAKASFKDGNHNLSVRVTDKSGNLFETSTSFFTDSKPPKIKSISPTKGFTSGIVDLSFSEENPAELNLRLYQLEELKSVFPIDLEEDCQVLKKIYYCSSSLDFSEYNSQDIEYNLELIDIVGNKDVSKNSFVTVDTSFPEIISITHTINSNTALITLDVLEENFDEATYINNADSSPRERTFCSSLENGKCSRSIALRPGLNLIDFQITDYSGNSVGQGYEITL